MPSRRMQVALAGLLVVLLMAVVTAATAASPRIPDTGYLLRDPTSLADLPWWVGSVSRMASLGWAVAATVNVLAALVAEQRLRRPLMSLGVLLAALAVDDTLLVHEAIMPARGIPEGVVLTGYAIAGVALAWLWLPLWRSPVGLAFFAGAGLLAVSVAIDAVSLYLYVPEDGAKMLGMAAWGFCGAWAFADALGECRT